MSLQDYIINNFRDRYIRVDLKRREEGDNVGDLTMKTLKKKWMGDEEVGITHTQTVASRKIITVVCLPLFRHSPVHYLSILLLTHFFFISVFS